MNNLAKKLSLVFAAGCLGGLLNSPHLGYILALSGEGFGDCYS
jgi:hypothetical protein